MDRRRKGRRKKGRRKKGRSSSSARRGHAVTLESYLSRFHPISSKRARGLSYGIQNRKSESSRKRGTRLEANALLCLDMVYYPTVIHISLSRSEYLPFA